MDCTFQGHLRKKCYDKEGRHTKRPDRGSDKTLKKSRLNGTCPQGAWPPCCPYIKCQSPMILRSNTGSKAKMMLL